MNASALQRKDAVRNITEDNPELPQEQPQKPGGRAAQHPLFAAFARAEHGRLLIRTPEDAVFTFGGEVPGPDAHLRLYDWNALDALIGQGEIGFAEAYMAGQWDTDDLPALLTFGLANAEALERYFHGRPWYALWIYLRNVLRGNSIRGSRRNIKAHYDLGNAFYALWLDKSMTYSCALFAGHSGRSLEEAQRAKYARILDRLSPAPGAHILEIGCGWGGFAEAAARKGCRVTGITISDEQKHYADIRLRAAGLDHLATIELCDYRQVTEQYDYMVSIGMFEHVGQKYWPDYFSTIKSHLTPGGKAMIQCITLDDDAFERLEGKYGFIDEYIFPGGMLPSKSRFSRCVDEAGLQCRDMFVFGQDYATTLRHWLRRFEAKLNKVRALGYDERFVRMWRFYLSACIASFASKRTDVMQVELTHA